MSTEELDYDKPALAPDKPHVGRFPAACPVIGLGASAGGLDAFQSFLAHLPADSGHAYVLVQHLDPNHESMLAELLSRRTTMRVRQVTDGMVVEPDNFYLIPPNASLVIEEARLRLHDFSEPRGFRRPIDVFFRSLALDQGPNSACIVLSGTGSDGSEGLRAVKEAGGLTLVQEPETAKYEGMPQSAVATGLVDKVLPVHDMPGALRDYFNRALAGSPDLGEEDEFLKRVCQELRRKIGHDFSQYKRSTMLRRAHRRMQVVAASSGDEYLKRLRESDDESGLLFRDLLINVTSFFRDAEPFDYLRREIVPALLRGKGAADTVRIWTPGCSSGEEAYSIAILLAEQLSRMDARPRVQIFATDIDEQMLQKAREARYPPAAVKDVPGELLDRHFFSQDDAYVLNQSIRDMVRVSSHNLIKDPPFSRVDMVVCRNLLIYLNPPLQQRLIPVFHYALKQDGWLFLGSAENIANRGDLFDTVDAGTRIFRRKGGMRQSVAMPLFVPLLEPTTEREQKERFPSTVDRVEFTMRRIGELYAPAHVVVNESNDVVRSSSRTGKYLELAVGLPSHRITDLAKPGLRSAIRSLLDTARRTGKRSTQRKIRIDGEDEGHRIVTVTADPIGYGEVLLVFQDQASDVVDGQAVETEASASAFEDNIRQLEDELAEARTRLRTTVEELETSNEELKSSNEEMMSMNEELQSTNEELATVNEELKNKVDQVARANSDLQNFIESTQVPTIFLDRRLRIRSFTPACQSLFRFQDQEKEKGRPLSDVVTRARIDLEQTARGVLETGEAVEREFSTEGGEEDYVLRALPYQDLEGAVDGIVLVFTDVTKIRKTQEDLARNEELARQRSNEIETLYKTAPVGMALVDRNRRYLKVNQHFADLIGAPIEEHIGRTVGDMAPGLIERMDRPIAEVFEQGREVVNLDVTVRAGAGTLQDFLIDIYPYEEEGRVTAVGIILKDVSELRRLEKETRHLMDELQHRVKNTLATVNSIISQTTATKKGHPDLADTLKKRISALAKTHDLLMSRDWQGASLHDILNSELTPFGETRTIRLDGPPVDLSSKHAISLTLTVHELATNAAKYGALSKNGGSLEVTWVVKADGAGREVTITWLERFAKAIDIGTPVESFGTRLIKNVVAHDLRGSCAHHLDQHGLTCRITAPI
jgi:two-component system CheB/CheR fusion protein